MITGIDISKVEASRDTKESIVNLKPGINFNEVKVEKDEIAVGFTFTVSYENASSPAKNVGSLVITGRVLAKEAKKDMEDISNTWKTKNTLPTKFAEDVINLLTWECGARGTLIAYSLGLIPPLPMTRAKLSEMPTGSESAA